MSPLKKALPLILFLAGALLGQGTPADCTFPASGSDSFTSATTGTSYSNSNNFAPCRAFEISYSTTGFSVVSIQFETSPDNSSWTAVPNTVCSSTVQPPCVIDGANPSTTTGNQTFSVKAYGKFVRLNVTTATGSGTISTKMYGYKGLSAKAPGGAGGGGTITPTGTFTTNAVVTAAAPTVIQTICATCTLDANGVYVTPGAYTAGIAGANSGALALNGLTSGTAGFAAADIAGTAILYIMPSTNGAAGQVLTDNGVASCPTLVAGLPAVCHQLIWASKLNTFTCQGGLGDGTNAIAAATYSQGTCINKFGVTYTITSIQCWTDNAGTSTLNATNGAGTALLTGTVVCTNTFPGATGTQSGTTTIVSNDGVKFSFVADGTTKQATFVLTGTR
jgi:hypothetical protein